jgi:hypothetical protein
MLDKAEKKGHPENGTPFRVLFNSCATQSSIVSVFFVLPTSEYQSDQY